MLTEGYVEELVETFYVRYEDIFLRRGDLEDFCLVFLDKYFCLT